eukprot:CAMPEP_0178867664 /NCGR_PEP_ID=MMETSP0747-20121128/5577_1 /TAXON_ID=913974 /ORGANISM="Nitzschia punctata, Strain CCMP561" /LENGTH=185 /DNA_ID=CAMNT_0020534559 /DNA_START=8 /DNA_END=565 /DNA_ORIENTATION=-
MNMILPCFFPLFILASSWKFFKRVWHIRHRLDDNSPLLSAKAHDIIRNFHAKGGIGCPPELNSHEALREHVCFEEVSITLSGTDHVTGNSVYSYNIYTAVDLTIGYRFANVLFKNPATEDIGVDLSLINVVHEQHGGGGEPLLDDEDDDDDYMETQGRRSPRTISIPTINVELGQHNGVDTMKQD